MTPHLGAWVLLTPPHMCTGTCTPYACIFCSTAVPLPHCTHPYHPSVPVLHSPASNNLYEKWNSSENWTIAYTWWWMKHNRFLIQSPICPSLPVMVAVGNQQAFPAPLFNRAARSTALRAPRWLLQPCAPPFTGVLHPKNHPGPTRLVHPLFSTPWSTSMTQWWSQEPKLLQLWFASSLQSPTLAHGPPHW